MRLYLLSLWIFLSDIWENSHGHNYKSLEPYLGLYDANGQETEIFGRDCEAGAYFPHHPTFSCICLTGLWAFYSHLCAPPVSIIAGNNHCFQLYHQRFKQVSLLSSPNGTWLPTLVRMSEKNEKLLQKYTERDIDVNWNDRVISSFIVIGSSWELIAKSGKSICLKHEENQICHWKELKVEKDITKIRMGCHGASAVQILPNSCSNVIDGTKEGGTKCEIEDGEVMQELDNDRRNRVRRQAPPTVAATGAPGSGAVPNTAAPGASNAAAPSAGGSSPGAPAGAANTSDAEAGAIEDEDYINPAQAAVKNNPIVLEELKSYLDGRINEVTGAARFNTDNRFPSFQLLELMTDVMAATCTAVSVDHFKMALNAFINIQTRRLHVKEPYINEPTFERIKKALMDCITTATPHNFQTNPDNSTNSTAPSKPVCEGELPTVPTDTIIVDDILITVGLPPENTGIGYEPIIESVWKSFLNSHSYCFRKFSEYYNDHHTLTVTLLPFFTNDIQTHWYGKDKNGTYEDPPVGTGLLYGGLVGDHRLLMTHIDLCVGASRVNSPYPWLMSRPPKDTSTNWSKRRKRSVMAYEEHICLKTPNDIHEKLSHGKQCT